MAHQFDFNSFQSILPFLNKRRTKNKSLFHEIFVGIDEKSTVLDVGCGDGKLAVDIVKSTKANIVAIDNSVAAISSCQNRVIEEGLENKINISKTSVTDHLEKCDLEYDLIIFAHFVYHMDLHDVISIIRLIQHKAKKDCPIIFITTSKRGEIHNFFTNNDTISNIVNRGRNLESIYGNYTFGEDLSKALTIEKISFAERLVEFNVKWPFRKNTLQYDGETISLQAWWKFFSFIYRLPIDLLQKEFGDKLAHELKRNDLKLTLTSKDLIHVIKD